MGRLRRFPQLSLVPQLSLDEKAGSAKLGKKAAVTFLCVCQAETGVGHSPLAGHQLKPAGTCCLLFRSRVVNYKSGPGLTCSPALQCKLALCKEALKLLQLHACIYILAIQP